MAIQRYQELTGQRYGRWVVLTFSHINCGAFWHCRCDCGKEKIIKANNLRTGHSTSCGCAFKDTVTIHGEAWGENRTPEYAAWAHMLRRCKAERNYVDRGISVCKEWKDYRRFLANMGRRPSPQHSIERVDNDKGYSKANCIWATHDVQINNRRTTIFVTIGRKRLPLADACRATGTKYSSVLARKERGWPQERWFEPIGWHWSHDQ